LVESKITVVGSLRVTVRHGRQIARRSGVAALAGMKLARSHTGHEHDVVFNLFCFGHHRSARIWDHIVGYIRLLPLHFEQLGHRTGL
jgi:hypothetical protein